jgi:hypothetical protein
MANRSKPAESPASEFKAQGDAVLSDPFAHLLDNLRAAALSEKGELSLDLRRAAAQNQGLPASLAPVVDKIARHAYRITDEDILSLKQAGLSEDQIYELVVAAAVGRACVLADSALAALRDSLAPDTP